MPGQTLDYYVQAAGGVANKADVSRSYVTQPDGTIESVRRRRFLPDVVPEAACGSVVFVAKGKRRERSRSYRAPLDHRANRRQSRGHHRHHAEMSAPRRPKRSADANRAARHRHRCAMPTFSPHWRARTAPHRMSTHCASVPGSSSACQSCWRQWRSRCRCRGRGVTSHTPHFCRPSRSPSADRSAHSAPWRRNSACLRSARSPARPRPDRRSSMATCSRPTPSRTRSLRHDSTRANPVNTTASRSSEHSSSITNHMGKRRPTKKSRRCACSPEAC